MATTTNYGWDTPDDTDLVKDGAAAIRTLGSSIDTTTKNLNPETTLGDLAYRSATANVKTRLALGTAGQVLRVNSGGNAPEWATTADQTPLTTKGDVFTFDTADARLGVGANGTVLTADSAEATGLKWAAPAAGGMTLISTTTLSGSSITLTSIPQTFKDLRIIVRNFRPSTATNRYNVRVNGDTGTRYKKDLYLATSPNSNITFSGTSWELEDRAATSTGASEAYGDFTLPDYTNTTTWKMIWGFSFVNNTTTPTNFNFNNYMSIYNQTPAITSLDIFASTGTFTSGEVLLYGVK